MKKISVLSLIIFLFFSCDNTLDLVEEGADISVVYSLLSSTSNDQIVRLERGFIDPMTPATVLAQDASNLYYENATVMLNNLTKGTSHNLNRIESSELGLEREEGFFATDPNYIYHYSGEEEDFEVNDEVQLYILKTEDSEPVTATINLLNELIVLDPPTNFPTEVQYRIRWVVQEENPAVEYNVRLELNYGEADLSDEEPEFEDIQITWNLGRVKNQEFIEVPGIDFYKFLGNNLEEGESLVRQFNYFNVIVEYSGVEVEAYQNFLTANTGITSSQPLPTYSNLSSGLGLVAERERIVIPNQFIGVSTKDSLSEGRFTKNLNFQ